VQKINGLLNVLKPPGMTSFDVIAYLRGILKVKKIGHAGTLDPGAAGVLIICAGNATKAIEFVMNMDKIYRAELTLGISTDTQDSLGKVERSQQVNVSVDEIAEVIKSFIGEIEQVPPMYSAVRVDGRRLYDIAREGGVIEREPRKVVIRSINIVSINQNKILFDVCCSKGTYIRTLCSDIGDCLGCGGHMSFLIRKRTGIFDIDCSNTLEDILEAVENDRIHHMLIPVDEIFKECTCICLDKKNENNFKNGSFINIEDFDFNHVDYVAGSLLRVYDSNMKFVALGEIVKKDGKHLIKPKKMFQ